MRCLLLIITTLFAFLNSTAQSDTIFYRDGKKIAALVEEIHVDQVKYKKASNVSGPSYYSDKSTVTQIKYKNGDIDVFSNPKTKTTSVSVVIDEQDPYEGRGSTTDPNAAEYSKEDVLSFSEMVYYGIDYTNVRLIGSAGFGNPEAITAQYFAQINQQIVTESAKFDFKKAFRKSSVSIDLDMLNFANKSIDAYSIITNSPYIIPEESIADIINNYDPKQQEGIGFVIIMETMDKIKSTGSFYFVFFDIKTKSVLLTEKKMAFAQGFGFRNYWMSPIYEGLNQWNEAH